MNNIKSSQKTALLDLGGVVFQSTGTSNEYINWEVISTLNHKYGHELNIGKNRFPAFLKEYNYITRQSLLGEEFLEAVFDTLAINQELINLLSTNYKLIIVSDNYRENIAYISQRYQFSQWAVRQFYSFDYQIEKSNPDFFGLLLTDLQIPATELIYIDDSPSKIASAKLHGIRGILFHDNDQVRNALKKLSLL